MPAQERDPLAVADVVPSATVTSAIAVGPDSVVSLALSTTSPPPINCEKKRFKII